jgi:hypothetical protein
MTKLASLWVMSGLMENDNLRQEISGPSGWLGEWATDCWFMLVRLGKA